MTTEVLIFLIGIALVAILIVGFILLNAKMMRNHLTYDFKGHKIEVFTSATKMSFLVDDVLEDELRWGGGGVTFLKKIESDVIKIFINGNHIRLFINDEKQDIKY